MGVYEMVNHIPQTSTKQHVQEQCGIIVNDPISDMKPSMLTVTGRDGQQLVVKVLKVDLESAAPLEQREELTFEAHVAAQFGSMKELAFLPAEVKELKLEGGSWHCLVMRRLITTLAQSSQLPHHILFHEGARILTALQAVHSAGLVQANVKGDNIFIDQ